MIARRAICSLLILISALTLEQACASPGEVPALDSVLLQSVRDDSAFGNWEQAMPWEIPAESRDEHTVYWQAVGHALKTSPDAFAQAAQRNRHLTLGHCYSEPAKYRGQVLRLEGRLVRLKQLDPPDSAKRQGIEVAYEAWLYLDQPGTHPVCVILPRKPDSVSPGDGLNRRVAVDGYFFKRYQYLSGRLDAAGKNVPLNTVLLIAPALHPSDNPVVVASNGFGQTWLWLGGVAAVAIALVLAMTWWFRHNDRQVQTRLRTLHAAGFAGAAFDGSSHSRMEPGQP